MGSSHGGAAPAVLVATTRHAGADVHPRGADVGFGLVPEGGSSAAEGGNGVLGIRGAHGYGVGEAARRIYGPIAHLSFVAGGEDREDACCSPGHHIGPEGGIGPVHTAPGVVDHVGGFAGVGVHPVEVCGGQQPLKALVELHIVGEAGIIENLDRNPLGAGGHADLVAGSVVSHDDAHGVGAMIVAIVGGVGVGAREIEPVVIVISIGAAILALQGRVGPVHAAVHVGHHHPAPGDAEVAPYLVSSHFGDVPLYSPFCFPPMSGR